MTDCKHPVEAVWLEAGIYHCDACHHTRPDYSRLEAHGIFSVFPVRWEPIPSGATWPERLSVILKR